MEVDLNHLINNMAQYFNSADPIEGSAKKILIACMPKSASRRMTALITHHPDMIEAPVPRPGLALQR